MTISKQLLQATFKSKKFLVKVPERRGGRKTVTHNFVSSDRKFVEDLGLQVPDYNVTAILDTTPENYFQVRDDFISVLDSFGAGILQLPTVGQINAQVTNYALIEDYENLGVVQLNINFSQTNNNISPSVISNPISEASAIKDAGITSGINRFNDSFSASFSSSLISSIESLNNFARSVSESVNRSNAAASDVSKINNLITGFRTQILRAANIGSDTGASMSQLYNDVLGISASIDDALEYSFSTFNFNSGTKETIITAQTLENNNNIDAMDKFNRQLGIFNIYNLAVNKEYANVQELEEINIAIQPIYDQVIDEIVDDAIIINLKDIRNQFALFSEEQSIILPKLETLITPKILASKLAYSLYGDSTQSDNLLNINNIIDTTYLEGEIIILSEVS